MRNQPTPGPGDYAIQEHSISSKKIELKEAKKPLTKTKKNKVFKSVFRNDAIDKLDKFTNQKIK